jgi:hypothetical protein
VRAAALVLLLGVAGCGSGAPATPAQDAAAPCTSLPAADSSASLPEGFPQLPGQVLYGAASQGSTRILFGRVKGDSFLDLRDRLAGELQEAGYALDGTDQEAVEAEAHFRTSAPQREPGPQPREGSVRVKQLCEGVLEVRYRLSG